MSRAMFARFAAFVPPWVKAIKRPDERLSDLAWPACRTFLVGAALSSLGIFVLARLWVPSIVAATVLSCLVYRRDADFGGRIIYAAAVVAGNKGSANAALRLCKIAALFLKDASCCYQTLLTLASGDEVRAELIRALRRRGKASANERIVLGRAYEGIQDWDEAAAVYSALLEDDSGRVTAAIGLARCHHRAGRNQACVDILDRLNDCFEPWTIAELKADASYALRRFDEALDFVDEALRHRPANSSLHCLKARILQEKGEHKRALRAIDQAIYTHERNATAHYYKARICSALGSLKAAKRSLKRCVELDNSQTEAFLFLWVLQRGKKDLKTSWSKADVQLDLECRRLKVTKNERFHVRLRVTPRAVLKDCFVMVLEPYGGGIRVSPRCTFKRQLHANCNVDFMFELLASRSSAVNCGSPWRVEFLLISGDQWEAIELDVDVIDRKEGQAFLVVSEDHETGVRWDKDRSGAINTIPLEQARTDLLDKPLVAKHLAEKYGVKWTHMVDVGTAVGLIAYAGAYDEDWHSLFEDMRDYYKSVASHGHDCQLHLHLSAVPDSYFFCYEFDPSVRALRFKLDKKNRYFPGWQINSWANVTGRYGTNSEIDSRLGSLKRAKDVLERVLQESLPAYSVSLFRAGQWDLGRNLAEREKSILSLRRNSVVADSSATEGYSYYDRDFAFGAPVSRAVYWTCENNPNERAVQLRDAGLVEVLPVTVPEGRHPGSPRHPAKYIVDAYESLKQNGRIKAGRHIIMEMEHIVAINENRQSRDKLVESYGDWKRIERHFRTVAKRCRGLRMVGSTEAIREWLDYYTPELTAVIGSPEVIDDRWEFQVKFLGKDLLDGDRRPYVLRVPLPSLTKHSVRQAILRSGSRKLLEISFPKKKFLRLTRHLDKVLASGMKLELHLDSAMHKSVHAQG